MPDWLRKELEVGAKVKVTNHVTPDGRILRIESIANEVRGVIPVIAQLCEQDDAVSRAYLCHSDVTHVVKLAKEGGFCGYRNIQMMVSYIRDARSEGYQHFQGRLPSIIQIQDMIEGAWDRGFNSLGRIETGGIRGTRKYIGTPEVSCHRRCLNTSLIPTRLKLYYRTSILSMRLHHAQTAFKLADWSYRCSADAFNDGKELPTHERLLEAVEHYFLASCPSPKSSHRVFRTSLAPIYLQHPGITHLK